MFLYAPVGITPTKPLTPSHLKGLLLLDSLHKIGSTFTKTGVWHNRRTWDTSLQTIRFWIFLDNFHPLADYKSLTEIEIGDLYVECFQSKVLPTENEVAYYIYLVEQEGYVHPASQRIIEVWGHTFDVLGLDNSALLHSTSFCLSQQELLERLQAKNLLLDQRHFGGPVFLDMTSQGQQLRTLISEHGTPNYLIAILRDLLAHAKDCKSICLYHDAGVERDYVLLEKILKNFDICCQRTSFSRVPVQGRVVSAKNGGWHNYTAGTLLERVASGYSRTEIRLGFRLYFLHSIGLKNPKTYTDDGLKDSLMSARKILHEIEDCSALNTDDHSWQKLRGSNGGVNVYGSLSILKQKKAPRALKKTIVDCLT